MAMHPFYPTMYEQINYYRRKRKFLGILMRNRWRICKKKKRAPVCTIRVRGQRRFETRMKLLFH